MGRGTKKVGIAGKYNTRYGVKIRNLLRDIETKTAARHKCPACESVSVRRTSTGIFNCRHCNYTFTSGAYFPSARKDIKADLEKIKEKLEAESETSAEKKVDKDV